MQDPATRNVRSFTLRVTLGEAAAIHQAADALSMGWSALCLMAVTSAAHRLGLFEEFGEPLPAVTREWHDLPERSEPTDARFAVTFNSTQLALVRRAAALVNTSATMFVIGASLRFVSNMQQRAAGMNAGLARVILPAQYRRSRTGRTAPSSDRERLAAASESLLRDALSNGGRT